MEITKLLIVDDEQPILRALNRILGDMNLDITLAGSGSSALSILEKQPFDMVLTDQRMPGMTGVEFLSRAQRQDSRLICMIMTAYSDIQVAIKAINDIGIYKFIVKPWEEYDLRMTLEKATQLSALMKSDHFFSDALSVPSDQMAAATARWRATDDVESLEAAKDDTKSKGWQDINVYINAIKALPISDDELQSIFSNQATAVRKKIKAEVVEGLYDRDWCDLIGVDYGNPSQQEMALLYKFAMHRIGLIG
ncbi:MAG: response regulator [Desulfobacterales bacterium]|nr:response regulator [Desulfobacterales bacterium]